MVLKLPNGLVWYIVYLSSYPYFENNVSFQQIKECGAEGTVYYYFIRLFYILTVKFQFRIELINWQYGHAKENNTRGMVFVFSMNFNLAVVDLPTKDSQWAQIFSNQCDINKKLTDNFNAGKRRLDCLFDVSVVELISGNIKTFS